MKKLFLMIFTIFVLLLVTVYAYAQESIDYEITSACRIGPWDPEVHRIMDKNILSYWTGSYSKSTLEIVLPADEEPCGMLIEWFRPFERFDYEQFDENGNSISIEDSERYYSGYLTWLQTDEKTRKIALTTYKRAQISEISVYRKGTDQFDIQKWQNPIIEPDIMLLVAHADDEVLWFGGLLPYYTQILNKSVQVVYMTNNGRPRIQEAHNCLWKAGVRNMPVIVGLKDSNDIGRAGYEQWGGENKIDHILSGLIRKYKPHVVVTHDLNGEYGHMQHRIIAKCIEKAIHSAANQAKYSDTLAEYGPWSVEKLYLHLSDTNTIYMNWFTPDDALFGKTPIEVAEIAFQEHVSQLYRYSMEDGKKYDYTKFGLVYTNVGPDKQKNDFLENILR